MTKVVIEMSMSLDGFIADRNDRLGGSDGLALHDWLFSGSEPYAGAPFFRPEGRNRQIWDAIVHSTGALIVGRRIYDITNGWDGSHPVAGLPVVVLTHSPPADVPKGATTFTFCTSITEAVAAARAQAKGKDVMVHGASMTRQLVAAGLVDELRLHLAPVVLGDGLRLFERAGESLWLELLETVETPQAIHMRYKVLTSEP
jgi:dihydrofolate reductase